MADPNLWPASSHHVSSAHVELPAERVVGWTLAMEAYAHLDPGQHQVILFTKYRSFSNVVIPSAINTAIIRAAQIWGFHRPLLAFTPASSPFSRLYSCGQRGTLCQARVGGNRHPA
ncbi:MAG: hypothetical protein CM1200mP27_06660 [Chloroflexota bacterium]|nr:MAG: hypothetical protein CM1200mP27_06660 [Chloroflexota bacterium]